MGNHSLDCKIGLYFRSQDRTGLCCEHCIFYLVVMQLIQAVCSVRCKAFQNMIAVHVVIEVLLQRLCSRQRVDPEISAVPWQETRDRDSDEDSFGDITLVSDLTRITHRVQQTSYPTAAWDLRGCRHVDPRPSHVSTSQPMLSSRILQA